MNLLIILLKLLGCYFLMELAYSLGTSIPVLFTQLSHSYGTGVEFQLIFMTIFPVLMNVFLVFLLLIKTNFMARVIQPKELEPISFNFSESFPVLLLKIFGVILITLSIPNLVSIITQISVFSQMDMPDLQSNVYNQLLPKGFELITKIIVGVILICKSNNIVEKLK